MQTPAPTRKTPVSETSSVPLSGSSQGFGRVLTIVGADCALLECDGHIRLLALPVAERWLRQAQLTPDEGDRLRPAVADPLRLKVNADEKRRCKRTEPTG